MFSSQRGSLLIARNSFYRRHRQRTFTFQSAGEKKRCTFSIIKRPPFATEKERSVFQPKGG